MALRDDERLIEFATIPSTSDWLVENAATLADETWVRADVQTAGHGRHGRAWASPEGNLFASVLVRPHANEGPPQQLSFVAALALAEAVMPWTGRIRLILKWPNDLLLGGGKLAGILLQSTPNGIVIGFGVNLSTEPVGVGQRVACLAAATSDPPPPAVIHTELRGTFANIRELWRTYGFAPIRTAWLARATPVGWRTTVLQGDRVLSGTFVGLAEDGAMLLQREGRIEHIHAGEVLGL